MSRNTEISYPSMWANFSFKKAKHINCLTLMVNERQIVSNGDQKTSTYNINVTDAIYPKIIMHSLKRNTDKKFLE